MFHINSGMFTVKDSMKFCRKFLQDCDLFYVQTYVALFLVMQCDVFVCLFVCLFVFLLKEAQENDSQT